MYKPDVEIVIVIGLIPRYTRESPTIMFNTLSRTYPSKAITRKCIVRANVHKKTSIINNQIYFKPYFFLLTPQGLRLWRTR